MWANAEGKKTKWSITIIRNTGEGRENSLYLHKMLLYLENSRNYTRLLF